MDHNGYNIFDIHPGVNHSNYLVVMADGEYDYYDTLMGAVAARDAYKAKAAPLTLSKKCLNCDELGIFAKELKSAIYKATGSNHSTFEDVIRRMLRIDYVENHDADTCEGEFYFKVGA